MYKRQAFFVLFSNRYVNLFNTYTLLIIVGTIKSVSYTHLDVYKRQDQWSENARLAREEYVQGKLTAEEFLRKIDTTHELTSYEVDKIDLPDAVSYTHLAWESTVLPTGFH